MSQNIIRDIFDAKRDLDGVSSSLMRLAYSFAETGNTHIYERLVDFSERIDAAANEMEAKFNGLNHEACQASQRMVGELLVATLHGCISNP